MGRPEPCVLFAQSFIHSQLDEYVDEVLFAEPVVITACEFLEQNATPSTPNISLIGATSPPSFALEVFVHCEGESRFRRLCQPFLYSHSSSSVLEVEAVVTNHLVLRGSYRSLTLVVYGNTAEDLGQFNIDFDLDSSLANAVSSPSEGKLEDLPSALRTANLTFEESLTHLKSLHFPVPETDITPEMAKFLRLVFKILQTSNYENIVYKVVNAVVSTLSSDVYNDANGSIIWDKENLSEGNKKDGSRQVIEILSEATNELLELYTIHQPASLDNQSLEDELSIGSDDVVTSELLVEMFNQCFPCLGRVGTNELSLASQKENLILGLGVILLFCSQRESCLQFVNGGGMDKLINLLSPEIPKSTATILLSLGGIERATRHAIGCEGFLGWWPREEENVPIKNSDGYCHLLKILLEKQRHDVASLATYVLHRLRFYEVALRYESAVLSVLAYLSGDRQSAKDRLEALVTASCMLKQILKLLDFNGPIEDPSPMAVARKLYVHNQPEGLLSYGATVNVIGSCKYTSARWDIDTHLLFLLKERGFLPLSAALLSSPLLHSANGSIPDIFVAIATSIETFLLKLLFSRSGLTFLLAQPEATALIVLSLQDVEGSKTECMTLRQAAVFLSKGFVCRPQEVGMITELHLKVGTAIDRMLATAPHSDDFLWILWELCAISRSDCGRQALLALCHFPEAICVLMEALRSFSNSEPAESGSSSLSLAIFHFAAEIFEVMVTDSSASSLKSWIGHAVDLHEALHSSSPGSNRKDAPTRLLEWIDAGVVYHRNGAIGLLRYAAVLASGGDVHLTSTSVLVSDSIDVENILGDLTNNSDGQVVDNLLLKLVSDKYFDGITLRDTSVVQLTTTFRILAFISENPAVAASLFEEGALNLIYVVIINCKSMLERSFNTYDYLVDEGAECNTTSDLLMGRSHEQSLVDLMIPSLVLLINLLHKLRETKEQYRNKKLLNALLQLHREVSPRLAASAAELSYPYPSLALGFGAVCHLIASALAFWPVFGWSPGLFHCLLESVQATSSLALGPKDVCNILCLLGDLFPEEGIWLWRNEMPPLSALRTLSAGTILGPQAERDINWYLNPEYLSVLLVRLTPQLDRIAQIVLHFASTALVVIQDVLRVLIIRIACQRTEYAVVLLRQVVSWMDICINRSSLSETDIFKVHRLLCFLANLMEHPRAKTVLLKSGAVRILEKALQKFSDAFLDGRDSSKNVTFLSWGLPVFKTLALLFSSQTSISLSDMNDKCFKDNISKEEVCLFTRLLLKLCQVLPVGRELLACILTLKELASCIHGTGASLSIFSQILLFLQESRPDQEDTDGLPIGNYWRGSPPFLSCLKKLFKFLESKDSRLSFAVEAVYALFLCATCFSKEGQSSEGISVLKSLFGLPLDQEDASVSSDEKLSIIVELLKMVEQKISEDEHFSSSNQKISLNKVKEAVEAVLLLLQSTVGAASAVEEIAFVKGSNSHSDIVHSVIITSKLMPSLTEISVDDEHTLSFSHVWKLNENGEGDDFDVWSSSEKFVWECPDASVERPLIPSLPSKRKLVSSEGSGKRVRENSGSEAIGSNVLARGLSTASVSSGPTRRDNFRQRKPNTSRPPSMHVDDYVARERNIDGVSIGSNIPSSQRPASTSGRPPSIHVDEFMARQRERQKATSGTIGDVSQVRNSTVESGKDPDKLDRPHQLKADPDDDLQGIDIVFDEESESDDRLPFPQPDDNLQPAPVVIGESSPGSVVEETESDTIVSRFSHLNTPPTSVGGSPSDIPLRRPLSRNDIPISQETSVSSDKNLKVAGLSKSGMHEQSDESKYVSPASGSKGFDSLPTPNLTGLFSAGSMPASMPPLLQPTYYQRNSPQKSSDTSNARSHGYNEQKLPLNQPPLPPMPPPSLASVSSQSADLTPTHQSPFVNTIRDLQPPIPSGYPLQHIDGSGTNNFTGLHLHLDNLSSAGNSIASLSSGQSILDTKYSWNTVSSGTFTSNVSARPMPPLPPTPPPFSSPIAQATASNSSAQNSSYNQLLNVGAQPPLPATPISETRLGILSASGTSLASYSLPFNPPLASRPSSIPGTHFSSSPQQHTQSSSSLPHPVPNPLLSIQSVQPRPPPPPPPQLPRPQNPPQQPGQFIQPQPEQGMPLQQGSMQLQVQPVQVGHQLHVPQIQFYYQPQQQEPLLQSLQPLLEHAQLQNTNLQSDNTTQQQKESGMTLQQYFSSPEAIQALLSDRDKLCQLLEQHPKLMQMLQERLGHQ